MSESLARGVVILGAGQAGGRAAEALRERGHTGPLTIVGEEPHPPYERPPLSKEMLAEGGRDRIAWVRPAAYWAERDVALRLSTRATAIDRAVREVALEDGTRLPYGALLIATGARPRRLPIPGGDHAAVLTLRGIEDSHALESRLRPGARVVVIGAGFIGLEAAAAARGRGAEVTLLEIGDLPMARCVPPAIGAHYAALHAARGVRLLFGTAASRIEPAGEGATVVTSGGEGLPADIVVVGIGVTPDTALAEAAGLEVADGIVTDAHGRTSDPAIYAAGDVARLYNPILGRHLRLESWQNAQNAAIACARNMLGEAHEHAEIPWFWSDQYEVNLQIAGLPGTGAREVLRGALDGPSALHLQLDAAGRIACAIGLNAARDLRAARELMLLGAETDADTLADPAVKLTDLLRAAKSRRAA